MLRIPGILPVLLLAVAALAPALAAQDASDTPDAEQLLASFRSGYSSPDPEVRRVALETLATRSRGLADHGRSRQVAQALGLGLADPERRVMLAAVESLARDRDLGAAVALLGAATETLGLRLREATALEDRVLSQRILDDELPAWTGLCAALAGLQSERALAVLVDELRRLADSPAARKHLAAHRDVLVDALLAVGTRDAARAVISALDSLHVATPSGKAALHGKLRDFSARLGLQPVPDDAANMAHAWEQWLDRHGDKLPRACPNR
jgi:hypothetical protein